MFESNAAQRIVNAVKKTEAMPTTAPPSVGSRRPSSPIGFYWFLHGKLNGPLLQGSTAQMTVWFFNSQSGEESAGSGVITVYDWLLKTGQSIAAGKKVAVAFDLASGRYYVMSAEC
jgi:hypothetical protein